MRKVQTLLADPTIRTALTAVAPEILLGVNIVTALFRSRKHDEQLQQLLNIIDARLTVLLSNIATTKSHYYRLECETRAHELLEILHQWDS